MNEFNIRFSGDYALLKWILKKYKTALPYDGEIIKYTEDNFYSRKASSWFWAKNGVPTRAWNMLHKDLIMARLMGRIKDDQVKTLEQLKEEFKLV